jgi:DNA-binding transcriptional regulator YiaG
MTGEDLKALRKKHFITQPMLAELLEVSLTSVKHWEINHRNITPSVEKLIKIIFREVPLPNLNDYRKTIAE